MASYQRNLKNEFEFCAAFESGVVCHVGNLPWHLQSQDSNGMICVFNDSDAAREFYANGVVSLAGRIMGGDIGGNHRDFVIRRGNFEASRGSCVAIRVQELFGKKWRFGKARFRAIVPCKGAVPDFCDFFDNQSDSSKEFLISVRCSPWSVTLTGLQFVFRNCHYLVYVLPVEKEQSKFRVILETLAPVGYQEFCDAVRYILCAIGFFTGSYCFGPFWVFNAQSHVFWAYNACTPDACQARYRMFSMNPMDYFSLADWSAFFSRSMVVSSRNSQSMPRRRNFMRHIVRVNLRLPGIRHLLKAVEKSHFEHLLECMGNGPFAELFFAFQDLNSHAGGLLSSIKLVAYAACLEMSANTKIVTKGPGAEKNKSLLPKSLRSQIISRFKGELDVLCNGHADLPTVKNKLSSLFTLPNSTHMINAFKRVGVSLSKEDEGLFDLRNNLLHGNNIIATQFDPNNYMPYVEEVEEKCFRFHALIWRFIMKVIGYDGYYIDVVRRERLFRESKSNDGKSFMKSV